jgi:hypothetical protein
MLRCTSYARARKRLLVSQMPLVHGCKRLDWKLCHYLNHPQMKMGTLLKQRLAWG